MRPSYQKRIIEAFVNGESIAEIMAYRKLTRKQAEDVIRRAMCGQREFLSKPNAGIDAQKKGRSSVASDPLLAELIADIVRLDHESLLPDGDMVHVGTNSWAAEWVRRLTDAGIIPANAEAQFSAERRQTGAPCWAFRN